MEITKYVLKIECLRLFFPPLENVCSIMLTLLTSGGIFVILIQERKRQTSQA